MDRTHRQLKWFQALGPLFFLHRDPMPLVSIVSLIGLIFEGEFAVIDRWLLVDLDDLKDLYLEEQRLLDVRVNHMCRLRDRAYWPEMKKPAASRLPSIVL